MGDGAGYGLVDCVEVFADGEGGCGVVASARVECRGLERRRVVSGRCGMGCRQDWGHALPLFARW